MRNKEARRRIRHKTNLLSFLRKPEILQQLPQGAQDLLQGQIPCRLAQARNSGNKLYLRSADHRKGVTYLIVNAQNCRCNGPTAPKVKEASSHLVFT